MKSCWFSPAGWLVLALGNGLCLTLQAADPTPPVQSTNAPPATAWNMKDKIQKADAEWKKTLSPEQYRVLRQKGTERAFTGAFWKTKEAGTYRCAGCGLELFRSDSKFDSGCGWPSYTQPVRQSHVATAQDNSLMMQRVEVLCARCGGHLGHVFNDGPAPTGLRYCINSASLTFEKAEDKKAEKPGQIPR